MAASVKGKKSLYFPTDLSEQIGAEARRLDRSESWVLQRAWMLARAEIMRIPAPPTEGTAP